jgi:hypothetical protein
MAARLRCRKHRLCPVPPVVRLPPAQHGRRLLLAPLCFCFCLSALASRTFLAFKPLAISSTRSGEDGPSILATIWVTIAICSRGSSSTDMSIFLVWSAILYANFEKCEVVYLIFLNRRDLSDGEINLKIGDKI